MKRMTRILQRGVHPINVERTAKLVHEASTMSIQEQPHQARNAWQQRQRRLVEMQGFLGLADDELPRLEPWLRFAPAICAAWAAVATSVGSTTGLLALAAIAVMGAMLSRHPFDAVYNQGIRRVSGAPPIPRYGAPRRFACAVAAVWLTGTAAAFAAGAPGLGVALGMAFTGVALVPVVTGFCVPSFVFQQGRRLARNRAAQARAGMR